MTNYEKIKAMSVEEMAKAIDMGISDDPCDYCPGNRFECMHLKCYEKENYEIIAEWLESEVEEDMLPEICSCGYRFENDETICPNCGKKVEEDG